MNQYMISVWHVDGEEPPSEEEMQQIAKDVDTFNAKIAAEGVEVFGAGLHRPETATVVDASKGGDVLITDGPFAEAKEQIGGFWILKAPDLDAALKLGQEASAATHGPVEVRPIQEEAAE
jgi:hypothetical protein